MHDEQKYDGKANNSLPIDSTGNKAPQTASTNEEWWGNLIDNSNGLAALTSHLRYAGNAAKARLMLRSWFLSQVLQSDSPTTSNPGGVFENVDLYQMLDDFLSDLMEMQAKPIEGGEANV